MTRPRPGVRATRTLLPGRLPLALLGQDDGSKHPNSLKILIIKMMFILYSLRFIIDFLLILLLLLLLLIIIIITAPTL